MNTIKSSEAVVLHNIQKWQEEKRRREKRREKQEFKTHFNNVGDRIRKEVRV